MAVEDSTIEVDSVVEDEGMAVVEEDSVGRGECTPGMSAAIGGTLLPVSVLRASGCAPPAVCVFLPSTAVH